MISKSITVVDHQLVMANESHNQLYYHQIRPPRPHKFGGHFLYNNAMIKMVMRTVMITLIEDDNDHDGDDDDDDGNDDIDYHDHDDNDIDYHDHDDDDIETRRVLIELLAAYIGRFINVSPTEGLFTI